jgi:hypothetical protein
MFFVCQNCSKEYRKSELKNCGGGRYCTACYNEIFATCSDCERIYYRQEMHIIEDHIYCSHCFRKFAIIKEHNYIPEDFHYKKLKWENTLYLGIELEIETPDRNRVNYEGWAKKIDNKLKELKMDKFFYFKHDGTVCGFELVSQPLTLQFFHKKIPLKLLCEWLRKEGFTSFTNGTCGLHVHLNKGFFDENMREIDRMRMFFSTNKEMIRLFSKRFGKEIGARGIDYCKYEKINPFNYLRRGLSQEDKYYALRLNPEGKHTIEMRVFRGTLFYPRIVATLQFADALAHYCKEISILSTFKTKSWNDFIDWCKGTNRYHHFIDYIKDEKNLVNFDVE